MPAKKQHAINIVAALPFKSQWSVIVRVHRNQATCSLDIKFCHECPLSKALSCTGYSVYSGILEGAVLRSILSFTLAPSGKDRSVIIRHFPRVCHLGTTPM